MSSLLLDTHILLWWLISPAKIGTTARKEIRSVSNIAFVSSASIWEMSIKASLGRLDMPNDLLDQLEKDQIRVLQIGGGHALRVRELPPIHTDPFDRMLIAQAQLEKLTIITRDSIIARYPEITVIAG